MGKRKRTSAPEQNAKRLDSAMTRMLTNLRENKPTELSPLESALMLKLMAYALQKMNEEAQQVLSQGLEDE